MRQWLPLCVPSATSSTPYAVPGAQYVHANAAVAGAEARWIVYGLMSKIEDAELSHKALTALLQVLLRKRVR